MISVSEIYKMEDLEESIYSSWVVRGFRLLSSFAVGTMSIILNSVTIFVLSKSENNCFGEITTIFVRALAWNNLFSGLQLVLVEIIILLTPLPQVWPDLCILLTPLFYTSINLSALFLCCLSIDRYVAVSYPLRYPIVLTKTVAVRLLLIAAHSGTISCWLLFFYHHFKYRETFFSFDIYYCQTIYTPQFQDPIWILLLAIGIVVPTVSFTLITVVNIKLFIIAVGHVKRQNQVATTFQNGGTNQITPRVSPPSGLIEMKALRSVLTITLCFYLTYAPVFVDSVLQFLAGQRPSPAIFLVTYYAIFCNGWTNCLIYVFMFKQFRTTAKRYIPFL